MQRTDVVRLPQGWRITCRLDLTGCAHLQELPANLTVGSLVLRDCTALEILPEGLSVDFLDVSGCRALARWPERGRLGIGALLASDCVRITSLPPWLSHLAQLDVSGCVNLCELPEGLRVASWIEIADTGISSLPASMRGAELRWRGVTIDERIAFHPETITAQEVLDEPNTERRRVMLERMGYEAFFRQAEADVLNRDYGSGGVRRLLRIEMPGDEPLVCVSVICPSTGRQYILRVPPQTQTCHEAVAWVAGFDDPADYDPLIET
jgi:hypothetical protein